MVENILLKALDTIQSRGKEYDSNNNNNGRERSMEATVKAFEAITGVKMTTEQGWLFMVILKAVRSQQGHKMDNYVDGSAYFALAGEQAYKDGLNPQE